MYMYYTCAHTYSTDTLEADLDGDKGRQLLRVLIEMVMVNHSPLASHALRLLIRHFSQRKELADGFKQVCRCTSTCSITVPYVYMCTVSHEFRERVVSRKIANTKKFT